jgi:hypothetical protein
LNTFVDPTVPLISPSALRRLVLPVFVAAFAACGGGGTEPPVPTSVVAVSANPVPSVTVGTAVATAPTFEVRSSNGRAMAGIPVSVTVTSGGGALVGAPTVSLAGPTSIGQWTLGTTAGAQTVTVSSAGLTPLVFTLNATAAAPTQLAILDGDDQFGSQNSPTFAPLRVRVRDQYDNNAAGVTVTWAVDAGGGSLAGGATTSVADANGIATAPTWTLGTIAAGEQAVQASVGGLNVRFTATAQRAPAEITLESVAPTSLTVNSQVAPSLQFAVRDSSGVALQGVPVSIAITSGNGTLTGAPTVSAVGSASIGDWRIGIAAGSNVVTLSMPAAPHVGAEAYTITGTPGPASVMVRVAGDAQTGLAGATLPVIPRVRVTDAFANGLPGLDVVWTVLAGGGSLGGTATVTTDATGFANAPAWTLGRRGGPQALEAEYDVLTAGFTATIQTQFNVIVRFAGTAPVGDIAAAFVAAEQRIEAVIVGDVPDLQVQALSGTGAFDLTQCSVPGITGTVQELVDDVLIYAIVTTIDGPNGVLGSAGPCLVRNNGGPPILGMMRFDVEDLNALATNGRLNDVVVHEMMHVVGMGTRWGARGILADSGLATVRVTGPLAAQACVDVGGGAVCPGSVPAENCIDVPNNRPCGAGTQNSHWKESTFLTEIMTGYANTVNQMSRMTVQGLADLGYSVNLLTSDPYTVPTPTLMALLEAEGDATVLPAPMMPRFEFDRAGRIRRIVR